MPEIMHPTSIGELPTLRRSRGGSCYGAHRAQAAAKIEFSILNGNLMVPAGRPPISKS
jgi:hypothetical protein